MTADVLITLIYGLAQEDIPQEMLKTSGFTHRFKNSIGVWQIILHENELCMTSLFHVIIYEMSCKSSLEDN